MDANIRETLRGRVEELKTLRDEIRVDLKLASMDLRDEWGKLEKRIPEVTRVATDLRELASQAADELLADIQLFRTRLRTRTEDRPRNDGPPR